MIFLLRPLLLKKSSSTLAVLKKMTDGSKTYKVHQIVLTESSDYPPSMGPCFKKRRIVVLLSSSIRIINLIFVTAQKAEHERYGYYS